MNFSIEENKRYKLYKYNFYNLSDLYDYLKSNPEVNTTIFEKQASLEKGKKFAGKSLEESIEYLRGGYEADFDKFKIAVKEIRKQGYEDQESRKLQHTIHGGVYLSPLVAAGVPDCMIKYKTDSEPKHITIYFQLACSYITTPNQIFNRGISVINLIQALEAKGYIVDLKLFDLSCCEIRESSSNPIEFINIIINVKSVDELLNLSKCYYPFVSKEFLRRVLFRVVESVPVKNFWGGNYGRPANFKEIKKFYKLKEKDLIIGTPYDMEINGINVYEDTYNLFKNLNLDNEFDLHKLKEKIKIK